MDHYTPETITHKGRIYTRDQLEDLSIARAGFSIGEVQCMDWPELIRYAEIDEPPKPEKPRKRREKIEKPPRPYLLGAELIAHNGQLCRRLSYSNGSTAIVKTGERVEFEGRTVSAALVLHYLQTGERLQRIPRAKKTHQAAIRHNGRVLHLGRFASKAEAVAARDAARLRVSLGLNPLG